MMHMANPDGFLRTWHPLRPWLTCPHCQRRGAVQRRIGIKSFVSHRCPGPFVLDHVEEDALLTGGYRLTINYKDYQPQEGDRHVCDICRDRSGENGGEMRQRGGDDG